MNQAISLHHIRDLFVPFLVLGLRRKALKESIEALPTSSTERDWPVLGSCLNFSSYLRLLPSPSTARSGFFYIRYPWPRGTIYCGSSLSTPVHGHHECLLSRTDARSETTAVSFSGGRARASSATSCSLVWRRRHCHPGRYPSFPTAPRANSHPDTAMIMRKVIR